MLKINAQDHSADTLEQWITCETYGSTWSTRWSWSGMSANNQLRIRMTQQNVKCNSVKIGETYKLATCSMKHKHVSSCIVSVFATWQVPCLWFFSPWTRQGCNKGKCVLCPDTPKILVYKKFSPGSGRKVRMLGPFKIEKYPFLFDKKPQL